MIPILYDKTETAFTSNGLGRLVDCIRCIVTEERNGMYECEFDYPVAGAMFDMIQEGRIIGAKHDDNGDVQPFDIYAKTEPINGVVTFYAHHISYRMNENTVKPFSASSCAAALQQIKAQSVLTNPFTYWTDKSVNASYVIETPRNIKSLLCGEQGSILDVYGTGEYQFDKWDVKLYLHRGQDTNVSIRYGKNLVDFENKLDLSDIYTGVVPFWYGDVTEEDGDESETVTELVTLPEWFLSSGHVTPTNRETVIPLDLSDEFEEKPTVDQLRSTATSRLSESDGWVPKQNISVNFVQLWNTPEYVEFAALQRLKLCDTCGVFVPMYNISLRAKVIKVVYNTLLDRYDSMELGDNPVPFSAVVEKLYDSKVAGVAAGLRAVNVNIQTVAQNAETYTNNKVSSAKATIESEYEQAISDATDKICGGTGGYVVTTLNANGKPIELVITDNLDLNQAVNVWRWNQGGLGHSHNGYNGPYNDIALTYDGKINASMISVGTLNANVIRAGTLQDVNGNTSFNLATGELDITKGTINLGNGNFTVNNSGEIAIAAGNINVGNGKFYVSPNGIVEMTNLEIGNDFKVNNAGTMWANNVYISDANCSFTDTFVKLDPHSYTTANQPNLYISGGCYLYESTWTASSKTIKEKIRNIAEPELNPKNLYDVDIVQFKYVDDFLSKSDQRHGKNLIGFIIEDLEEKFPVAVDKNGDDPKKWNWNMAYLIPAMMKLIQDQHKDIEYIKKQLEANNGRENEKSAGECS